MKYKDATNEDLMKTLRGKREALRAFRFNISGTRTRNVKEGRTLRKDIARLMTEHTVRKRLASRA